MNLFGRYCGEVMENFKHILFRAAAVVLVVIAWTSLAYGQYQTNGDANETSCGCFEVTNAQYQSGSVWNVTLINLNQPFDFTFDVFFGCVDWQGADGMAFVLQPLNVNAGSVGNGLGYGGIDPSLAVEYDTFNNGATTSDLVDDHIAIQSNGVFNHGVAANNLDGPVNISSTSIDVEDCAWHTTQITWNPVTQTFSVYFDGALRVSYTGDIINNIFGGNPEVYWGFTGSTGDYFNQQQFCINLQTELTIVNNNVCMNVPVQFTEASSATNVITDYSWDFGDGTFGNGQNVSHPYTSAGTYDVVLTITSDACTESFTDQVTIIDEPPVDLGPDLVVCDGESVQLNIPNTIGSGTFAWDPPTYLDNIAIASPTSTPLADVTYTLTYTENGCVGTDDIIVIAAPPVVANAGLDVSICDGLDAQLTATGGVGYTWDNTGTLNDPLIAAPMASPLVNTTYTVTVSDANGCTDIDDLLVTVNPLPILNAGPDLTICQGNGIQLNATGVGTFNWDTNPTLTAINVSDPTASPTINTTYTVTLTDANNCVSTDDLTIAVVATLPVDAGIDVTICSGETVQLTGTGAVNYSWDSPTDLNNPLLSDPIFNGTSTTILELTGTDGAGCSATDDVTITVNQTPVANMVIDGGNNHCDGNVINFDASTSTGTITTYLYDFGDQILPPGSTSTMVSSTFLYPGPGDYLVSLAVDNGTCADTIDEMITVHPHPIADFVFVSPCAGEAFNVTENSTVVGDVLNSFVWDFGNGVYSGEQVPTHAFSTDGTFGVELIVGTAGGCFDTILQSVDVKLTPTLIFSVEDACVGAPSLFSNSSTPNNGDVVYNWTLGDGNISPDFLPLHTYAALGSYGVTLEATTLEGCTISESKSVEVHPLPEVDFLTDVPPGCHPYTVSFENYSSISSGSILSYSWDVEVQSGITEAEPNVVFNEAGSFTVSLTATSAQGCVSSLSVADMVEVELTPTAAFDLRPGELITMLDPTIRLENLSANALNYSWTFGDSTGVNTPNPTHQYGEVGDYTIHLVAINGRCTDEVSENIRVDPETFIYAPSAFTPNGDGNNDVFLAEGIGIQDYNIFIVDRWGQEMFHSANITYGWDGTFNGRAVELGVYSYRIDIINALGEEQVVMGHVTLLR
ncbi:MAG: gliding motility-associated-like protein [Flavobacteriales bacterium]|jgi:gliding motility-associated-like protein